MSLNFKTVFLASAAALAVSAASAQDYYSGVSYPQETETVIVVAPAIRGEDRFGLNAPERLRLSQTVSFGDLDLRNPGDADELKVRVVDAARDVCLQLHDASPAPQLYGSSCIRDTRQAALIKAQHAIRNARQDYDYGYRY